MTGDRRFFVLKNLIKSLLISVMFATSAAIFVGQYVFDIVSEYEIDKDLMYIQNTNTIILDYDGDKIGEFQESNKSSDRYFEIPRDFIQEAVATEDREFFEHSGVDLASIFRAFVANIKAGGVSQGGSTITQQLIKQVYLDSGRNIERKKDEAIISTILETDFSKQELMAYYLNHNFYGNQAYGLRNALSTYFDLNFKEFKKEGPGERAAISALLIGLPNAPSVYNPYENPDYAIKRRNSVLTNMYVEGYIERDVYEEAKELDLLILDEPKKDTIKYFAKESEAVTAALLEAAERLDIPIEDDIFRGYRIETVYRKDLYDIVKKHIAKTKYYPTNPQATVGIQGAAVFVDSKTGRIIAMTGDKEEVTETLTINRAMQSKRQPGSALKPILPYGAALESGTLSRYSVLSCKNNYNGYKVNASGCQTPPTMHDAVKWSLNPPAVWSLEQIGIDYAREYTEKLGIELHEDDVYLPMALGGMKRGVTPLELADAYQVFLNKGKRTPAHFVTEVRNDKGEIVLKEEKPEQLISEKNAEEMKKMLRSVVTSGTGKDAHIPGYNIGGKTGTNEIGDGTGNSDVWFVGVSESVVGVIWMGYDESSGTNKIPPGVLSHYPAKLFSSLGRELLPEIDKGYTKKEPKDKERRAYTRLEDETIQLKWSKEKDAEYYIYRDGALIEVRNSNEFNDEFVNRGETYQYKIEGYHKKSGKLLFETKNKKVKLR